MKDDKMLDKKAKYKSIAHKVDFEITMSDVMGYYNGFSTYVSGGQVGLEVSKLLEL